MEDGFEKRGKSGILYTSGYLIALVGNDTSMENRGGAAKTSPQADDILPESQDNFSAML